MTWYDKYKKETILVNQDEGHNKMWSAILDANTNEVSVRWSRIGCAGGRQVKKFGSQHEAADFIRSKVNEKRRKGYTDNFNGKPIDDTKLEELCIEAAIVGTSNKCHTMQWVEISGDLANGIHYTNIDQARLMDPTCNPALLVDIETKKTYCGVNRFSILFTPDAAFFLPDWLYCAFANDRITASHGASELTKKVEEAIGRKFSS